MVDGDGFYLTNIVSDEETPLPFCCGQASRNCISRQRGLLADCHWLHGIITKLFRTVVHTY